MNEGRDDGFSARIESTLRSPAWVGQILWLYQTQNYAVPLIGNVLGISARHGSLRMSAPNKIRGLTSRGSNHEDILAKLIAVQKEKLPN